MADIFRPIEPFELTQGFGENPASYAKFGLKGHNGWDLRTKLPDTPQGHRDILSSWLSEFYRVGVDPQGYGNFFEVVVKLKSIWKLTYAHCLSIQTFKTRGEGESMAISDNTGNSTGAHLHLTVKRIKIVNGVHETQDNNNGFFGAVDPQQFFDEVRSWKNSGKEPKPEGGLMVQLEEAKFMELVQKSTNRDELYGHLGLPLNPVEPNIDKPKSVIEGYKNLATGLQGQLAAATAEVQNREEQVKRIQQTSEATAKTQQERIDALEKGQISFEKERESLKGQLDDMGKSKGALSIENEQLKAKLKTAQDNAISTVSSSTLFSAFLSSLFRVKR